MLLFFNQTVIPEFFYRESIFAHSDVMDSRLRGNDRRGAGMSGEAAGMTGGTWDDRRGGGDIRIAQE